MTTQPPMMFGTPSPGFRVPPRTGVVAVELPSFWFQRVGVWLSGAAVVAVPGALTVGRALLGNGGLSTVFFAMGAIVIIPIHVVAVILMAVRARAVVPAAAGAVSSLASLCYLVLGVASALFMTDSNASQSDSPALAIRWFGWSQPAVGAAFWVTFGVAGVAYLVTVVGALVEFGNRPQLRLDSWGRPIQSQFQPPPR